jgi:hypothetical protein
MMVQISRRKIHNFAEWPGESKGRGSGQSGAVQAQDQYLQRLEMLNACRSDRRPGSGWAGMRVAFKLFELV